MSWGIKAGGEEWTLIFDTFLGGMLNIKVRWQQDDKKWPKSQVSNT